MAKKSVVAIKPDEEWRAESDLHTLMEAEKIKADPSAWPRSAPWPRKR